MAMRNGFRLAILQFGIKHGKQVNLDRAKFEVDQAAKKGAELICIPENFNFHPLGNKYAMMFAEEAPSGETSKFLAELAYNNKIYLLGGSIPEVENGKYYNTALAFDPNGNMIMKYRKNHLFDVDIVGKITYSESEAISTGKDIGMFETPFGKFGVGLCYDLRFPLLASVYANKGCKMLLYPAIFNMTTGPLHWELLQRARAVDNQVFVATISSSRNEDDSYVIWGHSLVVDPWGVVLKKAGFKDESLYLEIGSSSHFKSSSDLVVKPSTCISCQVPGPDLSLVDDARRQLPIRNQGREDLFKVVSFV